MSLSLDPASTAILAIHWQRDIVSADGAFGPLFAPEVARSGSLERTATLLSEGRAIGARIIYTHVRFRTGHRDLLANLPLLQQVKSMGAAIEGTPGCEIVPELAPCESDVLIGHARISGFHGTELDTLLRGWGIDTVVLAGVATNVSVEGTARSAADHGYATVVAADACSAANRDAHQASLETLALLAQITTVDEVVAALR